MWPENIPEELKNNPALFLDVKTLDELQIQALFGKSGEKICKRLASLTPDKDAPALLGMLLFLHPSSLYERDFFGDESIKKVQECFKFIFGVEAGYHFSADRRLRIEQSPDKLAILKEALSLSGPVKALSFSEAFPNGLAASPASVRFAELHAGFRITLELQADFQSAVASPTIPGVSVEKISEVLQEPVKNWMKQIFSSAVNPDNLVDISVKLGNKIGKSRQTQELHVSVTTKDKSFRTALVRAFVDVPRQDEARNLTLRKVEAFMNEALLNHYQSRQP